MSEPPSSIVLFRRVPAGVKPVSLERFARVLREDVAGGRPFECLITNDRELKRLNLDFRGNDTPTDVLSFPVKSSGADPQVRGRRPRRPGGNQHEAAAGGTKVSRADQGVHPTMFLGSLAVSWQRAAAQAREYGHSLDSELRILMLHGILHLLGMDHETDRGRMARTESCWRARLRLPDGVIERARR